MFIDAILFHIIQSNHTFISSSFAGCCKGIKFGMLCNPCRFGNLGYLGKREKGWSAVERWSNLLMNLKQMPLQENFQEEACQEIHLVEAFQEETFLQKNLEAGEEKAWTLAGFLD
jgi:hypothetical protein